MSEIMSGGFEGPREATTPLYEGTEDVQWVYTSQLPEDSPEPRIDIGVIEPGTAGRYLPPNYAGLDDVEAVVFVRGAGTLGYTRQEFLYFIQGAIEGDFDHLLERSAPDEQTKSAITGEL